jgi:hypothetical protein
MEEQAALLIHCWHVFHLNSMLQTRIVLSTLFLLKPHPAVVVLLEPMAENL